MERIGEPREIAAAIVFQVREGNVVGREKYIVDVVDSEHERCGDTRPHS